MKSPREKILGHYADEARTHGTAGTATIQDVHVREIEVAAIRSYLNDGLRVLDVGCGNGFTAVALARDLDVAIDAFDLSEDLIALARRQRVDGLTGTVAFAVNDVLGLDARDVYDAVYTERALQNLLGWEEQKSPLEAIARALKPGGRFIMLECFHTGLENLNAARAEFDLEPIAEPWYNRFFVESDVIGHMAGIGCRLVEQNCCLSGYYFASRVIYPALLPKGKRAVSSSIVNAYFSGFPPRGDFCPMKILLFEKG